eukprot:XP_017451306.1 PREDICTED: V-set and transmembrane domain-containing protein 5 isoform X2 [Rattus norvegicus]
MQGRYSPLLTHEASAVRGKDPRHPAGAARVLGSYRPLSAECWVQAHGGTGVCPTGQGVSLYIPRSAINATVQEDILLSVDYICHGVPTIEWEYTPNWGVQKIVEWKPGTPANVSQSHRDRVCTFDNGSIQLFSVGVRDSGYYVITVTEHPGSSQSGTILLHVSGKRAPGLPEPQAQKAPLRRSR